MRHFLQGMAAASLVAIAALSVAAGEAEKYTLRYKFHPGEVLRWQVEHQSKVRATISKDTQSTDTSSVSVKAWRVTDVRPDGTATFEHRVEWVDMRQTLTGRKEVRYDSRTGAKPPAGFEDAARSVGVPLSIVKIDAQGKVLKRQEMKEKKPRAGAAPAKSASDKSSPPPDGWITIPLPGEPVAVGHTWSLTQNIDIPLPAGGVKKIKAVQQFTLEDVKTGVATIGVSTLVLTPISDPAIESQLVQREAEGKVRFDIDAGRIIGQQMDVDKHVVGFRGEASSIHYVNRFSERLLPDGAATAGRTASASR
jgi:hypothetical protein